MIIDNQNKFVFVHIPKNAGTSAAKLLPRDLSPADLNLNIVPREQDSRGYIEYIQRQFGLVKHSTYREITSAFPDRRLAQYKFIAISRNPYSRAKSIYLFTLRADAKHRPDSPRYQHIKDMSFLEFLQCEYMQEKQLLASRSQIDFLIDQNGELKKRITVFKLEDISRDSSALYKFAYESSSDHASLPFLNHTRTTPNDSQMLELKPAGIEVINDLYYEDIAKSGCALL